MWKQFDIRELAATLDDFEETEREDRGLLYTLLCNHWNGYNLNRHVRYDYLIVGVFNPDDTELKPFVTNAIG